MKKSSIFAIFLCSFILVIYFFYLSFAKQISYYSAHVACGNYYISERPLSLIIAQEGKIKPFDNTWMDNLFYNMMEYSANSEDSTLTVAFGSVETKMKFYPSYGCSTDLNKEIEGIPNTNNDHHEVYVDSAVQKLIEDEYISDSGTRALVVMQKDKIIGQKFDNYSSINTPLLSWSMTKSLTSLLFGRLLKENLISLDEFVFPDSLDPKKKLLTYKHLLNHVDGLDYKEAYFPFTDFFEMFVSEDIGDHLVNLKYKYSPGDYWAYSSAATNLLTYKLTEIGNDLGFDIQKMFQHFLFNDLDIYDAVIAKDPSGNMIASSLGFLSPSSWLKIGQLMNNEGIYKKKQLIDKEFIEFMITPAILSNETYIANFGGQWWLNTNDKYISPELYQIKQKIFSANGFQGQRLMVIPDLNILIVRMGLTDARTEWNNEGVFVKKIIENVNLD